MTKSLRAAWRRLVSAILLLALLLSIGMTVSIHGERADATTGGTEDRKIAEKLQCPVCEGQSVADSASPVAQGMRDKIREMLAEGRSEQEIIKFFRGVYGDFVLRDPPKTGFASLLWWMPGVAVVAGLAVIASLVRRRSRRPDEASPFATADAVGLSPEEFERYRERLRNELEDRQVARDRTVFANPLRPEETP